MMTLYQVEWCPSCHRVRQVLSELGLTVMLVNVRAQRDEREDVIGLSGQNIIPVLQDGDVVVTGSDKVIAHLRAHYGPAPDAGEQAAKAAYRHDCVVPQTPPEALARLKEVLAKERFVVLAEVEGKTIGPHFPGAYWLLHAAVPAAAAKAVQLDAAAPSAVAVPFSVFAIEGGSCIAANDPVGLVWLFGEPQLNKLQRSLRDRLDKVFAKL